MELRIFLFYGFLAFWLRSSVGSSYSTPSNQSCLASWFLATGSAVHVRRLENPHQVLTAMQVPSGCVQGDAHHSRLSQSLTQTQTSPKVCPSSFIFLHILYLLCYCVLYYSVLVSFISVIWGCGARHLSFHYFYGEICLAIQAVDVCLSF